MLHNERPQAAPVTPVYKDFDEAPDWPQDRIVREFGRIAQARNKFVQLSPQQVTEDFNNTLAELFGLGGQERVKMWPERMMTSAATLARDAWTGAEPMGGVGERFPIHAIERAQEMAGLSGGAPLMAKPGSATLGAGMTRTGSTKLHPVETAEGWFAHQGEGPGKFGPFKTRAEVDAYITERGGQGPSAQSFYSAVEAAVREAPDAKMTPEQWGGYLRNRPGVKAEELDWIGLPEGQKISKQEMLNHAKEHGVQMKEVRKEAGQNQREGMHENDAMDLAEQRAAEELPRQQGETMDAWTDRISDRAHDIQHELMGGFGDNGTKFSEYQLPGGDNYREVLFTLPTKEKYNGQSLFEKEGKGTQPGSRGWEDLSPKEQELWNKEAGKIPDRDVIYQSSHWDEPNVLAHARVNDRTVPDVGKTLHLEEIQSDWHQAGRRQGYKIETKTDKPEIKSIEATGRNWPGTEKEIFKIETNRGDLPREIAAKNEQEARQIWQEQIDAGHYASEQGAIKTGVPDAPFKTSWPDLVLKRMIREAAENGYDAVSWTPGEAQAARYDLSKQVGEVTYDPTTKLLRAWPIDTTHHSPILKQTVEPAKLADHIGKEAANKLLETKLNEHAEHSLKGDGLKVGGEGMKGFYDDMLVRKANALGKKYGAKVEWKEIQPDRNLEVQDAGRGFYSVVDKDTGAILNDGMPNKAQAEQWLQDIKKERNYGVKVPVFRLTSELRDVAMRKGFPLFSAGSPFPLIPVDHDPFKESK